MEEKHFTEALSEELWNARYRKLAGGVPREPDLHATWSRVALALSAPESHGRDEWRHRFEDAMAGFRFLPGGRILAAAGGEDGATLFNCFAAGTLTDTPSGIEASLQEVLRTLRAGGGAGCDFSTLSPAGDGGPGPVAVIRQWDHACADVSARGGRDAALMGVLRVDHPDIEGFIGAKREAGVLPHFNLSVLVSDAFMKAVADDTPWELIFPSGGQAGSRETQTRERIWSGAIEPVTCRVHRTLPARDLWRAIKEAAAAVGEPGVIFIDRVDRANNLWYCETIATTNPCGEVPLPPHGACNLGSINLARFVIDPFGEHPRLDLDGIAGTTAVAVRMLDNVYEVSAFPLDAQRRTACASRRLGIGITGLADAFAMLGVRYGTDSSVHVAETAVRTVRDAAYRESTALAQERGAFPLFDEAKYREGEFIRSLPDGIVRAIHYHGIRNSHLLAVAPAGSISLLANNVSCGIEPIYALEGRRHLCTASGAIRSIAFRDHAWGLYRARFGLDAPKPAAFLEAGEVSVEAQLRVQAAVQRYVDQSVSKTVNLPHDGGADRDAFDEAYRLGVKGCTLFCVNGQRASPLECDGRRSFGCT